MKIIAQSVELNWITPNALQVIEKAGRVAYKSEAKITATSAGPFIRDKIMLNGHYAVLEKAHASFNFICDRGVSHELVRHRLFSFVQESTRYCNYGAEKHGNEITVIKPPFWSECDHRYDFWEMACKKAEESYLAMLDYEAKPQEARSVLPNSLKTEISVTGNFREWRHFFHQRTSHKAHPQMREIADKALVIMRREVPVVFDGWLGELSEGAIVHGLNCFDVPHACGVDYMHHSDDKETYLDQGLRFCGRCHGCVGKPVACKEAA